MWPEYYIAFILISTVIFLSVRSFISWRTQTKIISEPKEITVVIPFRNESKNLPRLFDSLEGQIVFPSKVIFVDDHSEDDGYKQVTNWCSSRAECDVISLQENQFGKKKAIEVGVQNAKTTFVLTVDADVWFESTFFESIRLSENVSMIAGPVVLEHKNWSQYFYSLEHLFFNSFNYLISPFYTLAASGANLIFKREHYNEFNNLEDHEHITSGDDHFLLRNFQSKGLAIEMTNDSSTTVHTAAPANLMTYLDQRIRWLGKTIKKTNAKELFFGLYISAYLLMGFVLLVLCLVQQDYQSALMVAISRFVIDGLIFLTYVIPLRKASHIWMLPFFQITYPIIYVIVLIGSIIYKPKWKGRKTSFKS